MEREIEETVRGILNEVDIERTSEYKVRKLAGEKLGVDLSDPDHKMFVRKIVESFLIAKKQEQDEAEAAALAAQQQPQEEDPQEEEIVEEEDESKKRSGVAEKEYDDDGDLIICRLSNKRRVTIQDFKGKTLVSMREYYEKDGKEFPSSKVIKRNNRSGLLALWRWLLHELKESPTISWLVSTSVVVTDGII